MRERRLTSARGHRPLILAVWPAPPGPPPATTGPHVPAAWDRRSPTEQARIEELELADWLPAAVSFAPYWSDRAEQLDLDPGELVTRTALLQFPPTLQGDLAARGGTALVQRPTESQVKAVAATSLLADLARAIGRDQQDGKRRVLLEQFKPVHVTRGGVADELAIASSRADLDRWHRVGARAASVLGLGDHDYLVSAVPSGPTAEFWSVHALALGSSMLGLHPRGHEQDLDRCIEAFSLLPATAVACRPTDAIAWAHQLAAADADVSRVVCIILVGPPPTDDQREAVLDAWRHAGALESDLVVRSMWAPDVHRSIWVECAEGIEGLHTMPDLEVLEVLDAITGGVSEGGGDLTVTSLGWTGTTLLRFRTGTRVDRLVTGDTPCPACGRTVPRLTGAVQPGVWQPALRRDEGLVTLDLRALALELDATPAEVWRVALQRRQGVDGYIVELGGEVGEDRLDGIKDQLGRATGVPVSSVMVSRDPDTVANRIRILGSPFADNR